MPVFLVGSNTLYGPCTVEVTITGVCPAMGTPCKTQLNWNGSAWVGSAPVAGGTIGLEIPTIGGDLTVSACAGPDPWVGFWHIDFENQTFSVCYNVTFSGACCGLPPGIPTGLTICIAETEFSDKAPICACPCECDCNSGAPGGGETPGGDGPVKGVPPAGATPKQMSDAPIRYATGEAVIEADDLASGGFGTAWGHHRSSSNRLGVNQEFGNGYNWQVAQWPSLEPQPGGTLVVVGHNHEMLWVRSLARRRLRRPIRRDQHAHQARREHFLLSDTHGNVTEFQGQPLMFSRQYDAAGNVTQVVSSVGDGVHPAEVQRSFTDASGNTTIESYLYAYALGDDSMTRLTSVTLRRQVNGGAWQNVGIGNRTIGGGAPGFIGIECVVHHSCSSKTCDMMGIFVIRHSRVPPPPRRAKPVRRPRCRQMRVAPTLRGGEDRGAGRVMYRGGRPSRLAGLPRLLVSIDEGSACDAPYSIV